MSEQWHGVGVVYSARFKKKKEENIVNIFTTMKKNKCKCTCSFPHGMGVQGRGAELAQCNAGPWVPS